jgi:AraC-like DNA-binding protein
LNSSRRARPLDTFPAIRSADAARIEHLLSATYGARRLILRGGAHTLDVRANHWQSPALALSYCDYGADVEVEFPEASFFRQQFALCGAADIRIGGARREISVQRFCVVPPASSLRIGFRPGFEQLVLRVDAGFLNRKCAALDGRNGDVCFEPAAHGGGPGMARLRRLLAYFISELENEDEMNPLELAEFEQAIAVSFLCANPQVRGDAFSRMPSPGREHLRRVEDHIEAYWNKPLCLEDLSNATGVSVRTIFHHFRKWRGKTPMAFLKEVRLRRARALLLESPDMTVTQVAFACGFGNLGHFASDYRRYWGEKPSQTNRRTITRR